MSHSRLSSPRPRPPCPQTFESSSPPPPPSPPAGRATSPSPTAARGTPRSSATSHTRIAAPRKHPNSAPQTASRRSGSWPALPATWPATARTSRTTFHISRSDPPHCACPKSPRIVPFPCRAVCGSLPLLSLTATRSRSESGTPSSAAATAHITRPPAPSAGSAPASPPAARRRRPPWPPSTRPAASAPARQPVSRVPRICTRPRRSPRRGTCPPRGRSHGRTRTPPVPSPSPAATHHRRAAVPPAGFASTRPHPYRRRLPTREANVVASLPAEALRSSAGRLRAAAPHRGPAARSPPSCTRAASSDSSHHTVSSFSPS